MGSCSSKESSDDVINRKLDELAQKFHSFEIQRLAAPKLPEQNANPITMDFSGSSESKDYGRTLTNLKEVIEKENIVAKYPEVKSHLKLLDKVLMEQRLLATLVAAEPECVKLVAEDFSLLAMNPAGLNLIEADFDTVRNANVLDLVVPEDREIFRSLHQNVLNGARAEGCFRITGLKGTTRYMETSAVPFVHAGKTMQLALTRDVTVQKRHLSELQEAKTHAEDCCRAKTQFLANMSHELLTPLTAIIGASDLIQLSLSEQDTMDSDVDEYLEAITLQGKHLRELIANVLNIAQIESGHIKLDMRSHSVDVLLQKAVKGLKHASNAKGVELDCTVDPALSQYKFSTDSLRLTQILVNLIGNALKFTTSGQILVSAELRDTAGKNGINNDIPNPPLPGARTDCSISEKQPSLCLSVKDTGLGMTKEQLDRVFEQFTQANPSTKRVYGGSGLGLCISRKLTQALGGHIYAESKGIGHGSSFNIVFPIKLLTKIISKKEKKRVRRVPSSDIGTSSLNLESRATILLAEDSKVNQRVLSKLLEKLGCTVLVVGDGTAVVEKALDPSLQLDLIFLDINMPKMNGFEVMEHLSQIPSFNTPVIALTACSLSTERDRALASGCIGFLTKPVDGETLMDCIRQQLPHTIFAKPKASRSIRRRRSSKNHNNKKNNENNHDTGSESQPEK